MKSTRRSFFALLGALPFLGWFIPSPPPHSEPRSPESSVSPQPWHQLPRPNVVTIQARACGPISIGDALVWRDGYVERATAWPNHSEHIIGFAREEARYNSVLFYSTGADLT